MASILPTDDSFAEGATPYGAALTGWIASRFFTSQTFGPHGGQTVGSQPLHDGYQDGGVRKAAFAGDTLGERQCGVMLRDYYSADDVTVRMTQKAIVPVGILSNGDLAMRMQMVGARISGGTASTGTTPASTNNPQRIDDVDLGYFFGIVAGAVRASWFVVKIGTGGVVTVLSTTPFTGSGRLTGEIDPFQSFTLTMDVADSGSDVVLTCTATQSGSALPLDLRVQGISGTPSQYADTVFGGGGTASQDVFAITDSSSPIQTAGRVGFISTATNPGSGSYQVATLVEDFSYKPSASSTWTMVEEFDRFDRNSLFAYSQAASGFEGTTAPRDLRSTWGGDYFAKSARAGEMVPGAVGIPPDRVEVTDNGATETSGGFYPSQRFATNDRTTHRRIQFRFDTTGTGPTGSDFRQIGVGARGSSVVVFPGSGYEADVRPDENSLTGAVFIRRWIGEGAPTTIAEVTGLTVTPGTDYTLALRVYNLPDAQQNQDGIVVVEAYIDDVQVVLEEPSTPVAGITVLASGTVYDTSTLRTVSGWGEWVRLAAPSGVTKSLVFDTWEELSLEGTPGGPENDEVSISVSTEVTGHLTGTSFDNEYDWPLELRREVLRTQFAYASGDVRDQLLDANQRRVWTITAAATVPGERTSLRTLWGSARGMELSFEFTPPGDTTATKVHFASPELGMVLRAPGVYSFEFQLEEVFDA